MATEFAGAPRPQDRARKRAGTAHFKGLRNRQILSRFEMAGDDEFHDVTHAGRRRAQRGDDAVEKRKLRLANSVLVGMEQAIRGDGDPHQASGLDDVDLRDLERRL